MIRHGILKNRVSRNSSHRCSLIRNMLKSIIVNGYLKTSRRKAKLLKSEIDNVIVTHMVGDINAKRKVRRILGLRFNKLNPKAIKRAKLGDVSKYNSDRLIFTKLDSIVEENKGRTSGFVTIIKSVKRVRGNGTYLDQVSIIKNETKEIV